MGLLVHQRGRRDERESAVDDLLGNPAGEDVELLTGKAIGLIAEVDRAAARVRRNSPIFTLSSNSNQSNISGPFSRTSFVFPHG